MNYKEELDKIRQKCLKCDKCPLAKTRTNIVFSDGIPNNKLVLVGEAPGYYEDMQGLPFVGRAGQLLDKILNCVGFSRKENIYIINTIKCRPPNNRDPEESEKAACKEYLEAQLNILKPKIILICGNVALKSLLSVPYGITRARGKWFDGPNGARMMPIYHPSYLLRNDSREVGSPKWQMWQDIKEVRKVYDEINFH